MGTTYSHEWFMENIIESKDSNANRHNVLCSVVVAASKSLNSQHLGPDHEQSLRIREGIHKKDNKNCESCPTQVTWKVKFK